MKSGKIIIRLIFIAIFAAMALSSGPARAYESGNLRLDGEFSYDGKVGNFYKTTQDGLTLALLKSTYANNDQWASMRLEFENRGNINHRQILDFKNYFYGASHTPQDLDFRNISNVRNFTNAQFAVAHTAQTMSAFYIDSFVNRYSFSALEDFSKDSFAAGYVLDHKTSDNTFFTLMAQNTCNMYRTHKTDDHSYGSVSFKALHKMPKISRTPSFFSGYTFYDEPLRKDPDYVYYTDLTYELKAEYGSNKMAYNPPGAYRNARLDYSLLLDFSPVSNVRLEGYVDRRGYDTEFLGGYLLNYDKSFVNLLYAHDMTPKCASTFYVDFTKYNYLNATGYNNSEVGCGNYISLKYSDDIYWNLNLKQTYLRTFQSPVNYPAVGKTNLISSWMRYLTAKKRLVMDMDYEFMNIGLNETPYYASYWMLSPELRYEQKVAENFYARTGLGGKVKKHEIYSVNDIFDIYGLIGLTVLF